MRAFEGTVGQSEGACPWQTFAKTTSGPDSSISTRQDATTSFRKPKWTRCIPQRYSIEDASVFWKTAVRQGTALIKQVVSEYASWKKHSIFKESWVAIKQLPVPTVAKDFVPRRHARVSFCANGASSGCICRKVCVVQELHWFGCPAPIAYKVVTVCAVWFLG